MEQVFKTYKYIQLAKLHSLLKKTAARILKFQSYNQI